MEPVRLLLVDDEPSFVEALSQRLRQRGFSVEGACGGPEALARLEAEEGPDVVILDLAMPGMDGLEALRRIKERRPLVEVVVLTGHAAVGSAVEAMKCGAFDYLAKPCDFDELLSKIGKASARKKDREDRILRARLKPYASPRDKRRIVDEIMGS